MMVLAGCDPFTMRVGGSLNSTGELVLLYQPCRQSELVHYIDLHSGNTVLWGIRSDEGSSLRTFTVGEQPPGFQTIEPATNTWRELDSFLVRVDKIEYGPFKRDDFVSDRVFVTGEGLMSEATFRQRDVCD